MLYRGREAPEEAQEAEEVGKPPERGLEKRVVTAGPGVNAWAREKEKTRGTESVPWLVSTPLMGEKMLKPPAYQPDIWMEDKKIAVNFLPFPSKLAVVYCNSLIIW